MNNFSKILLFVCCVCSIKCLGQTTDMNSINDSMNMEQCSGHCMCDSRTTPIGISTEHIHSKGEWMLSYSFMDMKSKGVRMGSMPASDGQVYKTYMMSPADMSMQMQMVMVMYGITNRLTVMAMAGFVNNYMNMNMDQNMPSMPGMNMAGMPTGMQTTSMGLGDTKLEVLYSLYQKDNRQLTGSMGLNIPTGSVTETGTTLLGENQRLAYNMQTGTGSYSILPGFTFTNSINLFAYGVEAGADIKTGNNEAGYKFGNIYHGNIWGAYRFASFVSGSLRAEAATEDKISGADAMVAVPIVMSMDPTTDTKNTGGQWMNLYTGLNFHFAHAVLNHFHFMVEYGLPVYQNLNGIQGALHSNMLVGLQYKL